MVGQKGFYLEADLANFTDMFIVVHKKIFFILSAFLMAGSMASMIIFSPWNYGIEFTGGTLLEVNFPGGRPELEVLKMELEDLNWTGTMVQPTGENNYIIRTKDLSEEERQKLINVVSDGGNRNIKEDRFSSIGPTIGVELRTKAWWAIGLVMLAIVFYVAFAFRHVSRPVSSWMYGLATVVALLHDVIIPTGVYVALGHYFIDVQIDALFVTAVLTILGFSVHDTIVVFDRIRENLRLHTGKDFEETVGYSVSQTLTRSINTSLTVLLMVLALYFIGGETTKNFAFVLSLGIIVGTYSSICIASPLLLVLEQRHRKKA